MQTSNDMAEMLNDTIWYIPGPSIKYAREIGTYVSYDIAAHDCFEGDIVEIVPDATSDRDLALRMCGKFNRYQPAPIHLEEAVIDMLDEVSANTNTLCAGRTFIALVRFFIF